MFKNIKQKIDKKIDEKKKDHYNKKLIKAVETNDLNSVKEYLNIGADANVRTKKGGYGFPYDGTALICASRLGNIEIVKLLLRAKAKVNETDRDGGTALYLAASAYWFSGCPDGNANKSNYLDIVKLLLKAGADADYVIRHDSHFQKNRSFIQLIQAAEKNKHIAEIRKNSRVLSLVLGPKPENNLLSILPPELLVEITTKTGDKTFNEKEAKAIANYFFKRPPGKEKMKENLAETDEFLTKLKPDLHKR